MKPETQQSGDLNEKLRNKQKVQEGNLSKRLKVFDKRSKRWCMIGTKKQGFLVGFTSLY